MQLIRVLIPWLLMRVRLTLAFSWIKPINTDDYVPVNSEGIACIHIKF